MLKEIATSLHCAQLTIRFITQQRKVKDEE
jgi:hypothetical protein